MLLGCKMIQPQPCMPHHSAPSGNAGECLHRQANKGSAISINPLAANALRTFHMDHDMERIGLTFLFELGSTF